MLVETIQESKLEVRTVTGEWSKVQPMTMRIEFSSILRQPAVYPLIVDIRKVNHIDDWGSEAIVDALEKAKALVASAKTYDLLKTHLELRDIHIPCFEDLESAKASLQ